MRDGPDLWHVALVEAGLRKIYDPTVRELLPSDWLKLIEELESSRPLSAESPDRVWERLRNRLA